MKYIERLEKEYQKYNSGRSAHNTNLGVSSRQSSSTSCIPFLAFSIYAVIQTVLLTVILIKLIKITMTLLVLE